MNCPHGVAKHNCAQCLTGQAPSMGKVFIDAGGRMTQPVIDDRVIALLERIATALERINLRMGKERRADLPTW